MIVEMLVATMLLLILLSLLWCYKGEQFGNTETETVTKTTSIMEDVGDVPTIKIVEKTGIDNIFKKIFKKNKKVEFKIKSVGSDYVINIPKYNDYNFNGKGIVIASSGNRYRYITGLYSNLYTIRKHHKSNIPIEIFYVGRSEEFSWGVKRLLNELGNIKILNLMDYIDSNSSEEELRGYQTKPLSVLCSSFEEIILMDADALCFVDPYDLFKSEGYDNQGMVLFRDYVDCLSFISQDFIETIGIGMDRYCSYTDDFEIDSSCIVLNKQKYWDALFTICIVNVKSDSYHKSKNVLGDKDTWMIGSLFVGLSPYISRPVPKVFINENNKLIVGHLQSTVLSDSHNSEEIYTHYNNQKMDLHQIDLEGWTQAFVKNPKSGEEVNIGEGIPKNVLDCFETSREAMGKILPHVPKKLKDKTDFVNGISKGLIP